MGMWPVSTGSPNHKKCKQDEEPMRTRSKYEGQAPSLAKSWLPLVLHLPGWQYNRLCTSYRNHTLFHTSVKCSHSTQSSSNHSKRKRFLLRGDWTDSIQCFTVDKFTRKESKKEGKRRRSDVSENSFASANSLESFSSGSSGGSVSVDTSTPKTLWSFQERPANSKQVLNESVVNTENIHLTGLISRLQ